MNPSYDTINPTVPVQSDYQRAYLQVIPSEQPYVAFPESKSAEVEKNIVKTADVTGE